MSGAQERTRTFTAVKPLAPEASASTNSATWARSPFRDRARAGRIGRRPGKVNRSEVVGLEGRMAHRCAGRTARLSQARFSILRRRRIREGPMKGLATVFGGSGFVGAQIIRTLAKRGYRLRVAVRRPGRAYRLPMLGDVGQIQILQANVRDQDPVARAPDGAEACVNPRAVPYG